MRTYPKKIRDSFSSWRRRKGTVASGCARLIQTGMAGPRVVFVGLDMKAGPKSLELLSKSLDSAIRMLVCTCAVDKRGACVLPCGNSLIVHIDPAFNVSSGTS